MLDATGSIADGRWQRTEGRCGVQSHWGCFAFTYARRSPRSYRPFLFPKVSRYVCSSPVSGVAVVSSDDWSIRVSVNTGSETVSEICRETVWPSDSCTV